MNHQSENYIGKMKEAIQSLESEKEEITKVCK